jgi:hypothetical protein
MIGNWKGENRWREFLNWFGVGRSNLIVLIQLSELGWWNARVNVYQLKSTNSPSLAWVFQLRSKTVRFSFETVRFWVRRAYKFGSQTGQSGRVRYETRQNLDRTNQNNAWKIDATTLSHSSSAISPIRCISRSSQHSGTVGGLKRVRSYDVTIYIARLKTLGQTKIKSSRSIWSNSVAFSML